MIITAALFGAVSATASVVFSDTFDNGDTADGWIVDASSRMNSVDYGSGGQLEAVTAHAQPAGLWHTFTDTTLADGEILRLTVDVMMSATNAQTRPIRFGLGYASGAISGGNVDGYQIGITHNGTLSDPRVTWLDGDPGGINWGNALTTDHGYMAMADNDDYSVTHTEMRTVQFDLERSGTDYIARAEVNGGVSGTTSWSSVGEISNFKFNAVGMLTPYNDGETWTYDNVTVEVIPEPATIAILGIGGLFMMLVRRLRI
jgi:hypothetical protein